MTEPPERYEWRCRSCREGEHLRCDLWRGCECVLRLGPDGHGIVLCEVLLGLGGNRKDRLTTPVVPPSAER